MRRLWIVLAIVGFVGGAGRPAASEEVDLELVLAVDTSGSVDPVEARLQRGGYVTAFTDRRVVDAIIRGTMGRIAVTYFEWGGPSLQRILVPWRIIDGPESASAFAAAIEDNNFISWRGTSISGAIDFAVPLFDANAFEGMRRVIDISGDGVNNGGRWIQVARDQAVARGIVINGLPIVGDGPGQGGGGGGDFDRGFAWRSNVPDLDRYYEENVIGGPAAFVVVAKDFGAFADAIVAKLIREIAGTDGPTRVYAGSE
jgi:hypothetical protein